MTPARRRGAAAAVLLVLVSLFPFIGRCAISSDGAEVVGEAASALVLGRFSLGRIPAASGAPPGEAPELHSKYGLFASLVPLPLLAAAWPVRGALGAGGVDALVSLTWGAGACAAALAFLALARALRPGASPFWAPAFLAGTFLWPYAADSFLEPFAAAGLAAGAAVLLRAPERAELAAAPWAAACLLKPLLWVTAPVLVLAAALGGAGGGRRVLRAVSVFGAAIVLQGAVNAARTGSPFDVGYGAEALRFATPLLHGLWGLSVSPGRGVFLYAPLGLVALVAVRRLSPRAATLCLVAPAVLLLVAARWWSWEGGSSWGPRHLLPVLPLLAAPAVLAPAALATAAVVLGVAVNLGGVLIAPGSHIAWAEALGPPAGARWPAAGPVRVSDLPALSPIVAHAALALRNVAGLDVKPPLPEGAVETLPVPAAEASVSPRIVRAALSLPRVGPMLPRLLVRGAAGFLVRGDRASARRLAAAAVSLAPDDPDARRLAAASEGPAPPP